MSYTLLQLRQLGLSNEVLAMVKNNPKNEAQATAISDLIFMFGEEDARREVTVEKIHWRMEVLNSQHEQYQAPISRPRAFAKYLYIK